MTAKRRAAIVAAWFVATALLVACARTIDWRRALDVAGSARPVWLAAAIVANGLILVAWTSFWRALLPPSDSAAPAVAHRRMFEIVSIASALMNTVPFGGGHASSIVLLVSRGGVAKRSALSVLALDQLGEGVAKVAIFLLVAALVPLPAWMRAGVTTASLAVAAWFVALVVASRWAHELTLLKSWRRTLRALVCVAGMKIAELIAIVAVQHAFGVDISLGHSLLVLAALVLATMLPVTPGNLGTYEASVFLAYRYLGVSPELALGIAVAQHVCFLLPAVGIGYGFLSRHALSRSAIASR
ncbi:MAG TPA: lysylphosphatidylglycerol synthase transmembrane domain-containing protein [Gemmatimonadaceae bacterium]|nr:lysylphosphatidylglycerol synthase transmembrane domain-containing protein [Gemmatimonadaceae bacterium]